MASSTALQAVLRELRQLRRTPGPLDTAKLTSARFLLRAFGGSDPAIALTRLTDLAAEHSGDREIEAAMASLGWGTRGGTALERLEEYGQRRFVDQRTVRRWSDEGIRKLASLILGVGIWIQPRIRQFLAEENGQIRFGLHIAIPPGLRMSTPRLQIGDREVEIRLPAIEVSSRQQDLRSGLEPLATLADLPLEADLQWQGEKFPVYETVTHGSRDVLYRSRIVFLSTKTTISRFTGSVSDDPNPLD